MEMKNRNENYAKMLASTNNYYKNEHYTKMLASTILVVKLIIICFSDNIQRETA
jgi:archaellum biogenesis protein FlaJ (TadC family)